MSSADINSFLIPDLQNLAENKTVEEEVPQLIVDFFKNSELEEHLFREIVWAMTIIVSHYNHGWVDGGTLLNHPQPRINEMLERFKKVSKEWFFQMKNLYADDKNKYMGRMAFVSVCQRFIDFPKLSGEDYTLVRLWIAQINRIGANIGVHQLY